jgi:hypothetical protein
MSKINVISSGLMNKIAGVKVEEGGGFAMDDVKLMKKDRSVHISEDDDDLITWMFLENGNFVDGGAFDYYNDALCKIFMDDAVKFLA